MNLRPDEISAVIRERIKGYKNQMEVSDFGTVIQVGDGVPEFTDLKIVWRESCSSFPVKYTVWL